jgi:hypothetical protein
MMVKLFNCETDPLSLQLYMYNTIKNNAVKKIKEGRGVLKVARLEDC